MSQSQLSAPSRRHQATRESVTTAVGIAAERVAFADRARDRARRVTDARTIARRLDRHTKP